MLKILLTFYIIEPICGNNLVQSNEPVIQFFSLHIVLFKIAPAFLLDVRIRVKLE